MFDPFHFNKMQTLPLCKIVLAFYFFCAALLHAFGQKIQPFVWRVSPDPNPGATQRHWRRLICKTRNYLRCTTFANVKIDGPNFCKNEMSHTKHENYTTSILEQNANVIPPYMMKPCFRGSRTQCPLNNVPAKMPPTKLSPTEMFPAKMFPDQNVPYIVLYKNIQSIIASKTNLSNLT